MQSVTIQGAGAFRIEAQARPFYMLVHRLLSLHQLFLLELIVCQFEWRFSVITEKLS